MYQFEWVLKKYNTLEIDGGGNVIVVTFCVPGYQRSMASILWRWPFSSKNRKKKNTERQWLFISMPLQLTVVIF